MSHQLPAIPVQVNLQVVPRPLTEEEKRILKKISRKKLSVWATAYFSLLGILLYAALAGPGKMYRYREITDEDLERINIVVPIVIGFFFIVLNIYFIRYFLRSVYPYMKDLKGGAKELIYFPAESYKTPFFDTYYLKTISRKKPMIRITKEVYDEIQPGAEACISISPKARFVFALKVGEKKMEFNENNSILDI